MSKKAYQFTVIGSEENRQKVEEIAESLTNRKLLNRTLNKLLLLYTISPELKQLIDDLYTYTDYKQQEKLQNILNDWTLFEKLGVDTSTWKKIDKIKTQPPEKPQPQQGVDTKALADQIEILQKQLQQLQLEPTPRTPHQLMEEMEKKPEPRPQESCFTFDPLPEDRDPMDEVIKRIQDSMSDDEDDCYAGDDFDDFFGDFIG